LRRGEPAKYGFSVTWVPVHELLVDLFEICLKALITLTNFYASHIPKGRNPAGDNPSCYRDKWKDRQSRFEALGKLSFTFNSKFKALFGTAQASSGVL
jgi:hypothetical protein